MPLGMPTGSVTGPSFRAMSPPATAVRSSEQRPRGSLCHGAAGMAWVTSAIADPHQAALVGPDSELNSISRIELRQQARDVGLHGRFAEVEVGCDLGVRPPAGDQLEHLTHPVAHTVGQLG